MPRPPDSLEIVQNGVSGRGFRVVGRELEESAQRGPRAFDVTEAVAGEAQLQLRLGEVRLVRENDLK